MALRGGPVAAPVHFVHIDPGWWRATTTTPPAGSPQLIPGAPPTGLGNVTAFDTTQETCTPFLNMPGTFLANTEYWKIACQAVPTKATYIKMTTGDVVDYFKPKEGKSICDMLTSSDQHLWSLDGGGWRAPSYSTTGLGGSGDGWLLTLKMENDKRDTPNFWGVPTGGTLTGGCCHTTLEAESKAWTKPFSMAYCGAPVELAPICTPLANVPGSFSADKDYWAQACQPIPMTAGFVKMNMGGPTGIVDYFRPPTGKTFCEMLTARDQHKWSSDGDTWVTPKYSSTEGEKGLGGSEEGGVTTTDQRKKVSFWGSEDNTQTGGCCYASSSDASPGFGKAFLMSYCEIAQPPPVNELVELLHSNEEAVQGLENEMSQLHNRLTNAETVNVDASGNITLARSGMFKLAVSAKHEADAISNLQQKGSLLGSRLDSARSSLNGAASRVEKSSETAEATAKIAQKVSSPEALKAQEKLNTEIWGLLDPTNKDSLPATELRVRSMEKDTDKFISDMGDEVKTVMVTKLRRSVGKLRKVIHQLGNAGKSSTGALGEVESDAPLGADLGLNDS